MGACFAREDATQRPGEKWRLKHSKEKERLGVRQTFRPWTSLPGKKLSCIEGEQAKDKLDIAFTARLKEYFGEEFSEYRTSWDPSKLAKGLFCDVSPCPSRKKYGRLFTLTRSSKRYSFELDTMLPPRVEFALLGFDANRLDIDALTIHEQRDLAGASISLPALMTILISMTRAATFELPLWAHESGVHRGTGPDADTDDDLDEVEAPMKKQRT